MYYTIKQLADSDLSPLGFRGLQHRVSKLLRKGFLDPTLFYKKDRVWQIHESILVHFQLDRIDQKNMKYK